MMSVTNIFSQNIITHKLYSSSLQEERSFRVWLPKDYDEEQKYHILYVLDASYMFDVVVTNVAYLSKTVLDYMPASIVVAIDYKTHGDRYDVGLSFDMTLDSRGVNFYKYINDELIPYVNRTYSTNYLNTIIGHSYTATYLLYNAVKQNENFQQYVFFAPEEDPDVAIGDIAFEASYIHDKKFVFVTATDDMDRRVELANTIYAKLLLADSATYVRRATVDATHMSMIPFAMPIAMKLLFDSYYGRDKLDVFIDNNDALNAETLWSKINDHNQQLYHCTVRKNAGNAISILHKVIDEKNYDLARKIIAAFTLSKDANLAYPNANLMEILGGFLEQIGDKDNAGKYYAKSITRYAEEQHEEEASFNVRRQYARSILAPQGKLSEAFETLSLLAYQNQYHASLLNYEKARLSAKYNYNNEEGIQYLEKCLEHKKYLSEEHWIEEHHILFNMAQCYANLKDKKRAMQYIDKALALDSTNEKYLLFRNNQMEEAENP
jgi:tetratricopeptide (TPR) repeat protein